MSTTKRRSRLLATLVLSLPAIAPLFPLIYMVSLSLKTPGEVFHYPPRLIPPEPAWSNYADALAEAPLGRFLLNSLVCALGITLLQLLTGVLAAYALSRLEFRGKSLVFGLIVATMMVPGEVTIVPNYLTLASLGALDGYIALIAPFAASGFGVFLLHQFFKAFPKELEEAARMDGASRLRILFQFLVPLSAPALVAFGIYAFVGAWNQYLWPLIVTQSTDMRTVQVGIGMFRSQNEATSWGRIMAATTMLVAPSVVLFVATQKQFVRGVTMSGIKG
jgi:ABC-type glycerol-3-phosphate transport system permease component